MKTSEILIQAKALIQNPENWYQGNWQKGNEPCYCSLGAIGKVMFGYAGHHDSVGSKAEMSLRALVSDEISKAKGAGITFAVYNDHKTHADVMNVFDAAIANCIKEND